MSQSGHLEHHVHLTLDRTGGKSLGFSICQYYDFQSTALALFVEDVVAGGIAANTEMIYDGDQIMKINGTSVDSFFDYDAAMDAITSSTKVQFELKPDDELPDYGSGIAKLLAASTKRSMSKPKRRSSVSSRAAAVAGGGGLGAHTGKFTPSTTTSTIKKKKKKAICLYDYTPDAGVDNELAFAKGDVLETLEEIDEDGFVLAAHIQGTSKGKRGMAPSNFLNFLEDVVIERPANTSESSGEMISRDPNMSVEWLEEHQFQALAQFSQTQKLALRDVFAFSKDKLSHLGLPDGEANRFVQIAANSSRAILTPSEVAAFLADNNLPQTSSLFAEHTLDGVDMLYMLPSDMLNENILLDECQRFARLIAQGDAATWLFRNNYRAMSKVARDHGLDINDFQHATHQDVSAYGVPASEIDRFLKFFGKASEVIV